MEEGTEKKFYVPVTEILDGVVKRIYVGGVGPGVTAADMEKTFSSLGSVRAVEFVRTNGRNIAFMDFEPSSERSLAKLFSTYNGCSWKGGKLKLEMAKEHYLARLKREWAEDAKLPSAKPSTNENVDLAPSHSLIEANTQIRLFFPKLRKVKTLPFKGTGKHKYSFQRIEIPPVPIHFCDCEEHSVLAETAIQKYLSPFTTVVHEKEHNMMTNVISKILGGFSQDTSSLTKMPIVSDSNTLAASMEDYDSEESELASDADPDNIVTNIGAIAEDDLLMRLKGGMAALLCQENGSGKTQYSNTRVTEKKADAVKRKKPSVTTNLSFVNRTKRARSDATDGVSKHEPELSLSQKNDSDGLSPMSLEDPSQTPTVLTIAPTAERDLKPVENAQLAKGCSWVQKSSWKDMVGEPGSSLFSISSIVTGSTQAQTVFPKLNESDTISRSKAEKVKSYVKAPQIDSKNSKGTLSDEVLEKGGQNHSSPKKDKPSVGQTSGFQVPAFRISDACPFMRCSESEQQWSKTRKALGGYFKSKSTKERASKFTDGIKTLKQ
ncbi:hypothetical protein HPP92_017041 [Vanilla planifolia]|uniref:RRM domain-containing protein n=1 Tax=Vanilla planifolia TaxID=51239 RepID=A0A835QGB4_VANPL|nr:hypothetical protein HPP92_017041 [Vanilla planifolia]